MSRRSQVLFETVRTEGGLLPADLLQRISQNDRDLEGLTPDAYHLAGGERLNEAVNRAWSRLTGAWASFHAAREKLPPGDAGTSLTRERWSLVLFQELGYGRLVAARAREIDGRSYPISHFWQNSPIHLVGCGVDLDTRTARVAGAARSSPHSLAQDFLNRSEDHLWGFLSNGLVLRILRDNHSLVRQAYVEFDLKALMEGAVYSDFALLWLVCHQSRVEAEKPEDCRLESWCRAAREQGTRALETLRGGVEEAIRVLGEGFLAHPANTGLREKLRSGALATQDYYRQLLRTVYRLLFLFVAEDRDLLLVPEAEPDARDRYLRFYTTSRLRSLAQVRRGTKHPDLWRGLRIVMDALGAEEGCPALALPPLGSFLWSPEAVSDLAECDLSNRHLLEAVRALAFTEQERVLRPVDYKNLGAEELGSVYESLLELHPEVHAEAARFTLETAAGHERRTTGSYYTPSSLVQCLLDTALDPVLEEAASKPDPEAAILALEVCDPASGSGHFLIAAAHRIARRLAAVRTGDPEPSPEATRTALRDVIGRCIHGVDINPMAVELCKVSLWMEALEPGKPLSFLDHRILCGNSLLGTTPALMADGIPDDAFKAIQGDDKETAKALRRRNKAERQGQRALPLVAEELAPYGDLAHSYEDLDALPDDSIGQVHEKEARWERLSTSSEYETARLAADAWCAAFVWRKTADAPEPPTHDLWLRLQERPEAVAASTRSEIARLAEEYRFFHWHLAFPDAFHLPDAGEDTDNPQAGWNGGFDVVLGNPPWERIKIQEKEWFATRRPDIASARNAAERRRMIRALREEDPALFAAFQEDLRKAEGESHLVRNSGRFPLCGRGDINTYSIFAETMRTVMGPTGRVGCVIPSGIATDHTTRYFFQDLIEGGVLASLYDFETTTGLFARIGHGRFKFCLLTLTGNDRPTEEGAIFAFYLSNVDQIREGERLFTLTAEEIKLLNPNTRTCAIFRTGRDAEITKAIYRRIPILITEGPPEENPWGVSFMAMFHMANDSGLFRTREQLEQAGWTLGGNIFEKGSERHLPLYEAKMVHHFDHRFGDYADYPPGAQTTHLPDVPVDRLQDPHYAVLPRYWVPEAEVQARLADRWDRGWFLGWRDVTDSTNERTVIASLLPRTAVGDKFLLMLPCKEPHLVASLLGNLDSLALDFAARRKIGSKSLKYFTMRQLPVLAPAVIREPAPWQASSSYADYLLPRVLELIYTTWDLRSFARDNGFDGPPFRWDEERRFLLRCELDAAFFHLYGIECDDVDYIMDTFPIVKRKDEAAHGEYRTKRVILDIYDAMQQAIDTGRPYQTHLDPPPADPRIAHPPLERFGTIRPGDHESASRTEPEEHS